MKEGIQEFIAEQSPVTDIFCFQEVYVPARVTFEHWLPGFHYFYAEKNIDRSNDEFWQATYVKDHLKVRVSETVLDDIPHTGLGLSVEIESDRENLLVCNVHGAAFPGEKLDTPEREEQSRTVIDFLSSFRGPKIIGGDFNLLPDTESVRVFEQCGYVDLIKEFGIITTRNRLAWENYPGHELYYSDYVFVSPEVKVRNFSVPNNEISDHLPLIVDIDDP